MIIDLKSITSMRYLSVDIYYHFKRLFKIFEGICHFLTFIYLFVNFPHLVIVMEQKYVSMEQKRQNGFCKHAYARKYKICMFLS